MFPANRLRTRSRLSVGRARPASLWLLPIALLLLVTGHPPSWTSPPASPAGTRPDGAWLAFESHEAQQPDSPSALGRISAAGDDAYWVYLPAIFTSTTPSPPDWWLPPVGATWQWQLTDTPINSSFDVDVYDIDLFENKAGTVDALHAQGRRVICYLSAGSWEKWRPDADLFPPSVLGKNYEGWPDEKWLDIRQIELLAPIMLARLDRCRAKGFDGVEPDNIDGYTNNTGFPLTYQDQLVYNRWLANEAHARGLSIGLKNDDEQVADLLPYFDWALTEDCFAQNWCGAMVPFIAAGKAVFAAEYSDEWTVTQFHDKVCPRAKTMGFSAILKDRDLDAWRRDCP